MKRSHLLVAIGQVDDASFVRNIGADDELYQSFKQETIKIEEKDNENYGLLCCANCKITV